MVEKWHEIIKSRDPELLDQLLADDVVFYSPVVFAPQKGKVLTKMYLTGAMHVLLNDDFTYVKEVCNQEASVLEFKTMVDDIEVNGVDIISWDKTGRIVEFKVMVRPRKALEKVQEEMWKLLQAYNQNKS